MNPPGRYRCTFTAASWKEIKRRAAARQQYHIERGTRDRRVAGDQTSLGIHEIGVAAEWTCKALVPGDWPIGTAQPDTGIDGVTPAGTVEVKGSKHPNPAILVAEDSKGVRAALLIVCQIAPGQWGEFTGWTDRATFLAKARREQWYDAGTALKAEEQYTPDSWPDIGPPTWFPDVLPDGARCSRCKRVLSVLNEAGICGACKYWISPEYAARQAKQRVR